MFFFFFLQTSLFSRVGVLRVTSRNVRVGVPVFFFSLSCLLSLDL